MNRIIATTLIAASAAFTSQVFASDVTQVPGTTNPSSIAYNPLATFESSRTRAEVRAEYIASRDEVAAMTAEDSGAFALAQQQANEQLADTGGSAAAD
jgi:hypothetical protein